MLTGGTWSGRDAAIAAGVGGLAGFVAPWAGQFSGAAGIVLQLGIGASANVLQYTATQLANGKAITNEGIGWAVLSGLAAGAIGARDTIFTDVGANFSPKLLIANSKNAFSDLGTVYNKMFNNAVAMQAMKNILSVNTIRSFLSGVESNLNYQEWVNYLKELYKEKTGEEWSNDGTTNN
jgi:hypothetical protein